MKRVLITGSAGLVGRALVEELRARGVEIVEMDLRASVPSDIRDRAVVRRALQGVGSDAVDGVIHLAAISRVAWGEQAPDLTKAINVTATKSLLEEISRLEPSPWLLFASSREVYGDPSEFPVRESFPIAPLNHYGRSKAEGERLVQAARASGLVGGIVRLSNVYGTEYDHPDRALPSLLWRAMQGAELQITGADNFFDFVHVDDSVRGILNVVDLLDAGRVDLPPIQFATGRRTSLGELAVLSKQIGASRSDIVILPARPFDVGGFCGSPERAKEMLGWEPLVAIEDGMERLRARFVALGHGPYPVTIPQ
jgi:nucleoside-diphosphate-sugar epimerase